MGRFLGLVCVVCLLFFAYLFANLVILFGFVDIFLFLSGLNFLFDDYGQVFRQIFALVVGADGADGAFYPSSSSSRWSCLYGFGRWAAEC